MRDLLARLRGAASRAVVLLGKTGAALFRAAAWCWRKLVQAPPRYLFWGGLILAVVLFLGVQAYIDSRETQIAIEEISLPKALLDRGYTVAHVERTLQKAVQNIEDALDKTDRLEKFARKADEKVGGRAVAYGISHSALKSNTDSMNWQIPGQTVSVPRLRRWLASRVPGAKKQITLSLRVIADRDDGSELLPIHIVADIATENAGYRAVPVGGTSHDLTDADSPAIRKIALELTTTAWPLEGTLEKLKDEIRELTLISPDSIADIEKRVEEYSPLELYALVMYVNDILVERFNVVSTSTGWPAEADIERLVAPSRDALRRLWRQAASTYPSPVWGRGTLGAKGFLIGDSDCPDIGPELETLLAAAPARSSPWVEELPQNTFSLERACTFAMKTEDRAKALEALVRRARRDIPDPVHREQAYINTFTHENLADDQKLPVLDIVKKDAYSGGMAQGFARITAARINKNTEEILATLAEIETRKQPGRCAESTTDYDCLMNSEWYKRLAKLVAGSALLDVGGDIVRAEGLCREGYGAGEETDDGAALCIASALERRGAAREAEHWYRIAYQHANGLDIDDELPELLWDFGNDFSDYREKVGEMLIRQWRLEEAYTVLEPTIFKANTGRLLAIVQAKFCLDQQPVVPGVELPFMSQNRGIEILARKAIDEGHIDLAKKHARQMIELDRADSAGHALLGWTMLTSGQPDAARRALERARAISPGDVEIEELDRIAATSEHAAVVIKEYRACAERAQQAAVSAGGG